MQIDRKVIEALAVTFELSGVEVSDTAARVLASDLAGFPTDQVLNALKRIRMDGVRPTVGNIIARLSDGRPLVEEAFAMLPRREEDSVVMTDEMREAWGLCRLLMESDRVAARMAFKEVYQRLIDEARELKRPPRWFPSLGTDATGRDAVLIEAARKGRLQVEHALTLIPAERRVDALHAIGISEHPLLAAPAGQIRKIPEIHLKRMEA